MPVEKKIVGYDPNGAPIYAGDAPTGPQQPLQWPTTKTADKNAGLKPGQPGYVNPDGTMDVNESVGGDGTIGNAISEGLSDISPDFVNNLLNGGGPVPNTYDSKGELAKSEAMTDVAWANSLAQARGIASGGAPQYTINAQQIAAPDQITTGQIGAQRIDTPGILQGQEATQLRDQQLTQAQIAANSPSAAAAQMRAAGGQISNQQLGQAAMARGPERVAMLRDAMLATGTQGMQAANSTAALAAQEQAQKQQAYTQALAGVRAGDVNVGQAQTQVGAANQQADLAAQQATEQNRLTAAATTGQQRLAAATANQQADLAASQATASGGLQSWTAQQKALNDANTTGLQAVGAQNQAQGVASGYGQKQDELQQKNNAGVMGMVGSVIGAISDETAKTGIQPVGKQDFLAWQAPPAAESQKNEGGLIGGILGALSDERTKRDVAEMGDREIADWAESVPTAAFRYKPGIDGAPDDGERYHLGTLARQLESTGPMGKMLVTERPDGYKQVEYGPTALMVGKGALGRADEALEWAKAAYAMAAKGKGLVTRG